MLKQVIIGTEYKKIKYHGEIKHVIFKCNTCGKKFSKMESYCRKQIKIHKSACCFCCPDCRNRYFQKHLPIGQKKVIKKKKTKPKSSPIKGWFAKIFSEE